MTLYHGSSQPNLTILYPHKQPKDRKKPAVYFSKEVHGPELYAVLKHEPYFMNIEYVTENGGQKFVKGSVWGESGPARFHKRGYVYTARSEKGIKRNPRADNGEYISRDPVHVAFYKEVSEHELRAKGWRTRRQKYGEKGHK